MSLHVTRNYESKCVQARVMRQKKLYQENFTLKECGTWEEAERAAKKWVNEKLPSLPPKMSSKGRVTRRHRSGEVGVYYNPGIAKRPNNRVYEYPRWIADWPGCPFSGGLQWSIRQFECDGAFVLAVLARRQEKVDRDRLLDYFSSIIGTPEHTEILSRMKM